MPGLVLVSVIEDSNYWKSIIESNDIRKDRRLYESCVSRSKSLKIDMSLIRQEYLETIEVDLNSPFHDFFMSRARNETLTYGSMPLYHWYSFFCVICGNKCIELKLIAGLVPTVRVRTVFGSEIRLKGFYNILSIFESLLNVRDLRLSLWKYDKLVRKEDRSWRYIR